MGPGGALYHRLRFALLCQGYSSSSYAILARLVHSALSLASYRPSSSFFPDEAPRGSSGFLRSAHITTRLVLQHVWRVLLAPHGSGEYGSEDLNEMMVAYATARRLRPLVHPTNSFFSDSSHPTPPRPTSDAIHGILRLGTKYRVAPLRRRALQHLSSAHPTSLAPSDGLPSTPPVRPPPLPLTPSPPLLPSTPSAYLTLPVLHTLTHTRSSFSSGTVRRPSFDPAHLELPILTLVRAARALWVRPAALLRATAALASGGFTRMSAGASLSGHLRAGGICRTRRKCATAAHFPSSPSPRAAPELPAAHCSRYECMTRSPLPSLPLTAPTPHSDCYDRMSHSHPSPPFSPASPLAAHRALHSHISQESLLLFLLPSTFDSSSFALPSPPPSPSSSSSYSTAASLLPVPRLVSTRIVPHRPPLRPSPLPPLRIFITITFYTCSDTVLPLEAGGEGPSERAAGVLVEPDRGRIRGVCMRRVRALLSTRSPPGLVVFSSSPSLPFFSLLFSRSRLVN
ncbi:hypothetical protein K438DRAFT_1967198 [Mycena galopus ATCC 62051]|nr:hypothetical protein K438DRAFT_1967198 [Mycena galopus ATCC 62051]